MRTVATMMQMSLRNQFKAGPVQRIGGLKGQMDSARFINVRAAKLCTHAHMKERRRLSPINSSRDVRESSHWPQHSSGKDDVKRPLLRSLSSAFDPNSHAKKATGECHTRR